METGCILPQAVIQSYNEFKNYKKKNCWGSPIPTKFILSLSLSIVHITHKGTAFQILLLLQLPNSLANTQTTKSHYLESPKRQNTNHQNYLATIQCSKNDKLTPRYFCTSTSFKDFPLCCLNLFQCYCPYERQNPLKTS